MSEHSKEVLQAIIDSKKAVRNKLNDGLDNWDKVEMLDVEIESLEASLRNLS